ncbi:Kinesin-Like Protein Kif13B [Manis pentadactyla]|nr:Kinesin-Like Protein Kif13B [Manis pentadactyla]
MPELISKEGIWPDLLCSRATIPTVMADVNADSAEDVEGAEEKDAWSKCWLGLNDPFSTANSSRIRRLGMQGALTNSDDDQRLNEARSRWTLPFFYTNQSL